MKARWLVGPLLLTAGSSHSTTVQAQSSDVYVVVEGDDCEVVAKKVYGDKKLISLLHEGNPQLGPVPHHLKPGQLLHVPKPGAEAKVTFIRKDVESSTPETHPAKVNEDLNRGHKVSTLASSSAEITFKDTTRIQLSEHTLVVILGGTSGQSSLTQAKASDTTLMTGELHAHLGALIGKPKPVSTPGAKVELGGEGRISVDEGKTTRLAVYQGKGSLASAGGKTEVNKGFGSKADLGKKPTKPKPLPIAPTWVKPPPRTLVALNDAELVASHTPAAPGTTKFHVQISRDLAFNDLVVDVKVPASIVDLDAKSLSPGVYHTRVSAIDDDKFEGAYGDTLTTHVVVATPVAATVGKRASLTLSAGAFCGLDGAPLAQVASIELVAPKPHVLRCAVDASGQGASELAIDGKLAGAIHTKTSFGEVIWNASIGSREIRLVVTDDSGAPVAHAAVTVKAPSFVTIDPVREEPLGTYVTTARFPAGKAADVVFVLDGVAQETVNLPRADLPSPAAAPIASKGSGNNEIGVWFGGAYAPERFGAGGVLGMDVLHAFRMKGATLAVGARFDWERYGVVDGEASELGDAMVLGVPVSLRLGRGAVQMSYVGNTQPCPVS